MKLHQLIILLLFMNSSLMVITFTVTEGFTSKLYIEYKKTKRKINKRKNKKNIFKNFPKKPLQTKYNMI